MSTNKGLTGEWINVFMCTSLHQGTSVLQEYRVIPLVHHIRKSFEQVWTYMKWTHLNKFWTSLNTFQHIWTSFKQVWSHLNTFEQVLNKFEHKWTHLNTYNNTWTSFEQVWTQMNTFEHIWTHLNKWRRFDVAFRQELQTREGGCYQMNRTWLWGILQDLRHQVQAKLFSYRITWIFEWSIVPILKANWS